MRDTYIVLPLLGDHFGQVPTMKMMMDSVSPFHPCLWRKWESNLGLFQLRVEGGRYSASCQKSLRLHPNLEQDVTDVRVNCKGTTGLVQGKTPVIFSDFL